jgi:hypothetical protein
LTKKYVRAALWTSSVILAIASVLAIVTFWSVRQTPDF